MEWSYGDGKRELEKIMMDYRWIFRLNFCTPRYIMNREIGLEKLKIRSGMRAMSFEEKVKSSGIGLIKECWREKRAEGWIDVYGKERKRFYNRYG